MQFFFLKASLTALEVEDINQNHVWLKAFSILFNLWILSLFGRRHEADGVRWVMNTVCEWGEAAVINHDKKTIWPIKDSRHAKAPLALMIWPSLAAPMVNHSNQSLNQHWLELIFSSKIIISTTKLFVVHFKSKHIRDYQGWKISRYLFLSMVPHTDALNWKEPCQLPSGHEWFQSPCVCFHIWSWFWLADRN